MTIHDLTDEQIDALSQISDMRELAFYPSMTEAEAYLAVMEILELMDAQPE